MTRESRIEKAKAMAAKTSAERAQQRAEEAAARSAEIAALGPSAAAQEANRIAGDADLPYLGPIATPYEWTQALAAARDVVLECASEGRTLTYAELQLAAIRTTGHQIGYSMYGTFCMEMNDYANDGCLISSIVVTTDSGEPGPGLQPYARSLGIDEPTRTLQRRVFERFGSAT